MGKETNELKKLNELQDEVDKLKQELSDNSIIIKDLQNQNKELSEENTKLTSISKDLLMKNSQNILANEKNVVTTKNESDEFDKVFEKLKERWSENGKEQK